MATYKPRGGRGRIRRPETPDRHNINDNINSREVRVISDDGEQLGVMLTREAISLAEGKGLDLVEVSGKDSPPVCKIMDYGKFKYREQKKKAEAKKKRSEITTKEIRIRYRTDVGDLETKLKHAREFLEDGDKVKFSMRFRGREIMYLELGNAKFDQLVNKLSDVADLEERSPCQGNQMYIVFAPKSA